MPPLRTCGAGRRLPYSGGIDYMAFRSHCQRGLRGKGYGRTWLICAEGMTSVDRVLGQDSSLGPTDAEARALSAATFSKVGSIA